MNSTLRCGLWLVVLEVFLGFTPAPCRADLWGLSSQGNGTPTTETQDNFNKVFRFDQSGNKLAGDIPRTPGVANPAGLAVGPDGNIYVSWASIGSILYYNGQTGAPLGTFAFLGDAAPSQLKFGPDGNLYVSEFFGEHVRIYNAHPGNEFGSLVGQTADHGLTAAGGLAFLPNGDLLIGDGFYGLTNFTPSRIAKVSGADLANVSNANPVPTTWGYTDLGSFYAPVSILTQADGSVLIADMVANYIAKVDGNGIPSPVPFALINPYPPAAGTNFPSDIKLDPDGNLMVSVLGETNPPVATHGALWRYDLNGNIIDSNGDASSDPIVTDIEPIGGIAYTPSMTTLAHDYDGDTNVGALDYIKWRENFAKFVANGNNADGNSNGVVEAGDYVAWRKAATSPSAPVLEESSVPEPNSLVILVSGLLAFCNSRRWSRR